MQSAPHRCKCQGRGRRPSPSVLGRRVVASIGWGGAPLLPIGVVTGMGRCEEVAGEAGCETTALAPRGRRRAGGWDNVAAEGAFSRICLTPAAMPSTRSASCTSRARRSLPW
ncbi:unnamed protein product [Urochloa humidicola]